MKPRLRIRSEEGFAVPTALMALVAITGIVTVGVITSVQVQSGVTRDASSKAALPQAEAAVQQALLHFNRIEATANPCSPVTVSGPAANGWCAPVTGGFDGGTYSFQVRPDSTGIACGSTAITDCLEIVGSGTKNGVSRRVHATAHSSAGTSFFSDATVKTRDGITMDSNAEIHSNSATNGDMTLASNAMQCGVASVGLGRRMTLVSNARYFLNHNCTAQSTTPGQAELSLPPVNQGDVATVNDNSRFFALDPVTGGTTMVCWNGVRANGTAGSCGLRHLDLSSNSSVFIGGAKYSFCKLTMSSNTSLEVVSGNTATIFFDSPEACGYSSGTTQLDLSSNARMTATGGGPANVALMFVGSSSRTTRIQLDSNSSAGGCEQNFVIYAPRTDIELDSNATFCGAIAGKSLHMDSNARIFLDSGASNFILPATAAHYELDRFVECNVTTGATPDSQC